MTRDISQAATFNPESKSLIIHADDFGMCHSVNMAIIQALECGALTSASAMVPCAWFAEAAAYASAHPDLDIGVHLTLTSEWPNYRWRPVSGPRIGLIEKDGCFRAHPAHLEAISCEVEIELDAQIQIARSAGLYPTHLDSHGYTLFAKRELFEPYVQVAHTNAVPYFMHPTVVDPAWIGQPSDHLRVDFKSVYHIGRRMPPEAWLDYYVGVVRSLKPGLNQLIVHPGYDDAELRAITEGYERWGAAWRQRDLDAITSPEFRSTLEECNVQLVNWKSVQACQPACI